MKRGDVYLCADKSGDYTAKPRPVLIVQADNLVKNITSITVCPLTSVNTKSSFRVQISASESTGLNINSSVEIDKITTVKVLRLRQKAGEVSTLDMLKIDEVLRHWLAL